MRRVRVAVGPNPYEVLIGRGVLSHPQLGRSLKGASSGIVVSSREVMRLHGPALLTAVAKAGLDRPRIVLLRDGEGAKTVLEWERMLRAMAKAGLDRSSVLIAFGGGSIGDAGGFAASAYMRGIRFVQIPTTLLAMVDSSVGGKTGINIKEGKNLVGAFHQPSLVLADLSFLRTLSARERQSGVYEILKCGLLKSARLLELIDKTGGLRRATQRELAEAIAGAVRIKARIVERDEREAGERVLLNLGHTLGHALEAATSYRVFTHGEAVGYGMEFVVDLSERLGRTSASTAGRMRALIAEVGPRVSLRPALAKRVREALLNDKKRQGLHLKVVLLAGPQAPEIHRMSLRALSRSADAWLSLRPRGGWITAIS
jgi:3-dehydroquinate synthase